MKKILLSVFVLLFLFSSVQHTYARDFYGAIAVSDNGRLGWSYDYPTRRLAEYHALRKCGYGCRIASWFVNACGAIAMNYNNSWYSTWGHTRRSAENKALYQCNRRYGSCSIQRWVCTTR